ncbi:hypothetical protein ACOME3_004100 [Neoechinorhynchus agilis]
MRLLYGNVGMTAALCSETLQELKRRSLVCIDQSENALKCMAVDDHRLKSRNLLQDIFATRAGSVTERYSTTSDKCLFSKEKLNPLQIPASIETLVLNQYDNLDITEQTILSRASIIGETFSRSFLYGICGDIMTKHRFNIAVQNLMSSTLLKCARDLRNQAIGHKLASIRRRRIQIKDRHVIVCECPENHTNLAFLCQMLSFTRPSLRWSLFNSQTKKARSVWQRAIIKWLEKKLSFESGTSCLLHSCVYCAGQSHVLLFDTNDYDRSLQDLVDANFINLKSSMKLEDLVQEIRLSHIESESVEIESAKMNLARRSVSWRQIGLEAVANVIMQGKHFVAKNVKSAITDHRNCRRFRF